LGMGLTMVGATVMGASAAYTLSDYPSPFVKNGMPNNVAVIVGDKSDPSDVVGMGDIVANLQSRSVTEVAVAGSAARVKLVGDSVEIGTPTDLLELEEPMGSVRPTLQEGDLNLLKGGSITTQRRVTKFNQYLKFNDSALYTSNLVRFDEDEFNQVGDFLYTRDGDNLFEWTLEFEEGFVSRASLKASPVFALKDFLDRDIFYSPSGDINYGRPGFGKKHFEEAKKFGAMSECEDVPVNRLLFKGGTNKTICNGYNAGGSTFTDNWWNAEGLIDNCEMPVNSNMQFIFKQHDQSIRSHTGVIQIKIDALNYNNYKALQIFTAEDSNNDNLPDNWKHCGNVDGIYGRSTKIIQCSGTNLKFIKLVNAEWNKGSLFIDNVEVLKI